MSEINASGGIKGKRVEVVFEDDRTDSKTTVGAVNKLISVDQVPVIIGATWDYLTNAAIPVIDEHKVVMITPSTLPDTLEATSTYLFETHAPIAVHETAVKDYLSRLKTPRVVIMSINVPWGKAHLETFRKAVVAAAGIVVKEVVLPSFDNNDIQGQLTLIKLLRPDVILTALTFSDSVTFLQRRAALGMGAPALMEEKIFDLVANGSISPELMKGISAFRFSPPNETFIENYTTAYGSAPREYADTAYDAVYAIKHAIESVGKTDSNSVRNGLKTLRYTGASGTMDFTLHNYPENETSLLYDFKEGTFQSVK